MVEYKEFMEYSVMLEFNKIRNKEFIPFQSFSKLYREAKQDALMPNSKTKDLVQKLVNDSARTSVIIVSGIPGCGKGRAAEYIVRQLQQEGAKTALFKTQNAEDTINYNSDKFIKAMLDFKTTQEGQNA